MCGGVWVCGRAALWDQSCATESQPNPSLLSRVQAHSGSRSSFAVDIVLGTLAPCHLPSRGLPSRAVGKNLRANPLVTCDIHSV